MALGVLRILPRSTAPRLKGLLKGLLMPKELGRYVLLHGLADPIGLFVP